MKNLPIYNTIINSLIRVYFNLYINPKEIYKKIQSPKSRRKSIKKIFVSNAEIKHTTSKALITIYTYDKQKMSLLLKIKQFKYFWVIFIMNKFLREKLYKNIVLTKKYKILRLMFLRRLKFLFKFYLNWYKFQEKSLYKLSILISKILRKKVEFRIIKLKNLVYNTDIFTEILKIKIKKDRANVLNKMNFIIGNTRLPNINRIQEKGRLPKKIDFSLIENKYKNTKLSSIFQNNNLDLDLDKIFSKKPYYNIISNCDILERNYTNIKNITFNSIKYKNIGGLRLEVRGRLTKRYRADRALFRLRRKGGLKNIDSSFKGLSTVVFRGYENPNVEYSIRTSKRRIGAFAVKGWISGR